ncbi:10405_t:CDS:2 [Acaulospora morrowiae]|uniref:10405_t:CDS:1 n=1 Tax=Acaulospora morrowiae TaxID=94023 RepID=A0A9N8YRH5_9GLOM|nr:10405_t:CDS:2 [Acaulospora morrowiae]
METQQHSLRAPLCFCKKLASAAFSDEFGLFYECHFLHPNPWQEAADSAKSAKTEKDSEDEPSTSRAISRCNDGKSICGFHIHKDVWDCIWNDKNYDPEELNVCPYFNFTYCAMFNKRNDFEISYPQRPICFCGIPVVARFIHNNLIFECKNYVMDGHQPKCTWHLPAIEVPFEKSRRYTHPVKEQFTEGLLERKPDESREITVKHKIGSDIESTKSSQDNNSDQKDESRNIISNRPRLQEGSMINDRLRRSSRYSEKFDESHGWHHPLKQQRGNYSNVNVKPYSQPRGHWRNSPKIQDFDSDRNRRGNQQYNDASKTDNRYQTLRPHIPSEFKENPSYTRKYTASRNRTLESKASGYEARKRTDESWHSAVPNAARLNYNSNRSDTLSESAPQLNSNNETESEIYKKDVEDVEITDFDGSCALEDDAIPRNSNSGNNAVNNPIENSISENDTIVGPSPSTIPTGVKQINSSTFHSSVENNNLTDVNFFRGDFKPDLGINSTETEDTRSNMPCLKDETFETMSMSSRVTNENGVVNLKTDDTQFINEAFEDESIHGDCHSEIHGTSDPKDFGKKGFPINDIKESNGANSLVYRAEHLHNENLDNSDKITADINDNQLSDLFKLFSVQNDDADGSSSPPHLRLDESMTDDNVTNASGSGSQEDDKVQAFETTIDGGTIADDSNDPMRATSENNELNFVERDNGNNSDILDEVSSNRSHHSKSDLTLGSVDEYSNANNEINKHPDDDDTVEGQVKVDGVSSVIHDNTFLNFGIERPIANKVLGNKSRENDTDLSSESVALEIINVSNENNDTTVLSNNENCPGHVAQNNKEPLDTTEILIVKQDEDGASSQGDSSLYNPGMEDGTKILGIPKLFNEFSNRSESHPSGEFNQSYNACNIDDSTQSQHNVNNDNGEKSNVHQFQNVFKMPLTQNFCISITSGVSQNTQTYLTIHEHCRGNEFAHMLQEVEKLREKVALSEAHNKRLKEENEEFQLNCKKLADEKFHALSNEYEKVRLRCEKLTSEKDEILSQFNMLADANEECNKKNKRLSDENSELLAKNSRLTHEVERLSEKVDSIHTFNDTVSAKNGEHSSSKDMKNTLRNKSDNGEFELENSKGDYEFLLTKYEKAVETIDDLRHRNQENKHQYEETRRQYEEIKRQYEEIKHHYGEIKHEYEHTSYLNVTLVKRIEKCSELSSENERCRKKLAEMRSAHESLEVELAKKNRELNECIEKNRNSQTILKNNNDVLRNELDMLRSQMKSEHHENLTKENNILRDENRKLKADLKDEINRLLGSIASCESEKEKETSMRRSCQKKVMELQTVEANLQDEIDNLKQAMKQRYEENSATFNRCKVCFTGSITHAIVPCHHAALCEKCASDVDRCVVCRGEKKSTIRVYIQ